MYFLLLIRPNSIYMYIILNRSQRRHTWDISNHRASFIFFMGRNFEIKKFAPQQRQTSVALPGDRSFQLYPSSAFKSGTLCCTLCLNF